MFTSKSTWNSVCCLKNFLAWSVCLYLFSRNSITIVAILKRQFLFKSCSRVMPFCKANITLAQIKLVTRICLKPVIWEQHKICISAQRLCYCLKGPLWFFFFFFFRLFPNSFPQFPTPISYINLFICEYRLCFFYVASHFTNRLDC